MLQETKLRPHEKIACDAVSDYQVFYLNRQTSQGGGIAVGVEKNIESTLLNEGENDIEVLSVKLFVDKLPMRIITAYGPQENDLIENKYEVLIDA